MRRIIAGLTGQTGAGKTTAAEFFLKHGFALINCDMLVHSLGDESAVYINAIRAEFGDEVISDGKVNRKALGQLVFSDKEKLARLNEAAFPIIREAMQNETESLFSKGYSVVVLDAPTLFESKTDKMCDIIISITTDEENLLQRIMKRDGISFEAAKKRISSQHTKEFFEKNSDYVIDNSGTKDDFILKLNHICDIIKERANED